MNKILKIAYNSVLAVLVLFLLAIAATFFPIPGNYKLFTVQSGSMEPKIKLGSLVFVKPAQNYNPGDIVTFRVQGGKTTVTHRILETREVNGETTFTTKGDANEESDTQDIAKDTIVGKVFLTLPLVGFPIGYAKTKLGFIILILIPSTIIIYEELRGMAEEIRKKFMAMRKPKVEKLVLEEEKVPPARPEENIRVRDYNIGLKRNPNYSPPVDSLRPRKKDRLK